jgi:hypothetical protein
MNAGLRSSGQIPYEKTIDVSEEQVSGFGHFPCAGDMVENPANL